MNLSGVFRQLAIAVFSLGLAALACAAYALLIDERELVGGFLAAALTSIFVAACLAVLVQDVQSRSGPREAIWFIVTFWLLMPFIAALPFLATGIAETFLQAWFEATSNLTTMGVSLDDRRLADPVRLWRSCLQFLGGVFTVGMAIVVMGVLTLSGPNLQRAGFLSLDRSNLFAQLNRVLANIALLFAGAVLVSVISMTMMGVSILDALTRSVAAITTSTTTPSEGDPSAFLGGPAAILCILLLIGATNMALHVELVRHGHWRGYLRDAELPWFLAGVVVMGLLLCSLRGAFDLRLFAESLSFLSTSGLSVTGVGGVLSWAPEPVPEFLSVIGGSALSTAGGIKLARVLILSRRIGAEFQQLAFSHAKVQFSYQGRAHKNALAEGVWVYIVAYVGVLTLIGTGLTFYDLNFETAFRAAIGAISNVGPLVEPAINGRSNAEGVVFLLALGAILGRIEIVAIVPLFTIGFWRK